MLWQRIQAVVRSHLESVREPRVIFFEEDLDEPVSSLDPDAELRRCYYGYLELPMGARWDQVQMQYRKLLKKYHPDLYNSEESKRQTAEELTAKLNEAYNYFKQSRSSS